MEISKHPIWNNISPFKKPAHLLRFILARNFAKLYPRTNFIAITGSVGKTLTAQACFAVLSQKYKSIVTDENLDSILNIPITLLKIRPNIKKIILEMGVEYPGEMDFYLSLVHPATAIVTRIYYAHSEFLGGIEDIIEEKAKLVKQLPKNGFAILNWDDIYTRKLSKETEAQVLFYGTDSNDCHVWASNIRIDGNSTHFELNYGVERIDIALKLLGKQFVYAALAAATLGMNLGISLTNIKKGLEKVEIPEHRLQLVEGLNDYYILDDTYNSSPAALEEAINVLNGLPARRRIVVLGEMRELGAYSEQLHRGVAQKLYKDKVDLVILSGGDTKYIYDELIKLGFSMEKIMVNLSNSQIVSKILKSAGKGDIVLVKGSHAVKLDEVARRISKPNKVNKL